MAIITYREALNQALSEEIQRDKNVVLMGEEVAQFKGSYKVSEGMLEKFGEERIIDTPISEAAFSGLAVGAAYELLRGPTEKLGKYLGNQLAKGIYSVSNPEVKKKLSTYSPSLANKQGPALTPDIVKGVRAREKQAAIDYWTSPEVKTQLDTITKTQTQAPSTTKTKVDTKDPKDPKTPPVKTLPIPVVKPPVAKNQLLVKAIKLAVKFLDLDYLV